MFSKKKWIAILSVVALLFSLIPSNLAFAETAGSDAETCNYITVDGSRDALWDSVPVLATSATAGWEGFQLGNLKLTNDCTYLYYFVDAVNVPNWGDDGQYLNLAISINGGAVEADLESPWGSGFNFTTAIEKPNYHITSRIKGDTEVAGAAIYSTTDFTNPLASTWGEANGAQFANIRSSGFEGKIPLALLNLQEGDTVKAIAVLSGNDGTKHGAFDVIPESDNNIIAASWDETSNPNPQADYSASYTITFEEPELLLLESMPANQASNVSVNLSQMTLSFLSELTWGDTAIPILLSAGEQFIDIDAQIENNMLSINIHETLSYDTAHTLTIPAGSITGLADNIAITFTTEKDPSTLNTYSVHYYRYDAMQLNWDIWTWDSETDGKEVDFTELNSDGYAVATITSYANSINVITRPGDWSTQEETRIISMPDGQQQVDVWLIGGDTKVYYVLDEIDLSKRVLTAFMDSKTTINITTSSELSDDALDSFFVADALGETHIPATTEKLGATSYRLTVEADVLDVTKPYTVNHASMGSGKLVFRGVLDDYQFYYGGDDLGLTYTPEMSMFKLWAPTASAVYVSIYSDAGQYAADGNVADHTGGAESLLERSNNGVWSGAISGNLAGQYYMYHVQFADGAEHYVVDPYARAVAANGARTAIVNLAATNPSGWIADEKPAFVAPTDAILYELHVRDFSISEDSGVNEAYKGKYLAFTETGLVDEHGNTLGIDHLAELGVTHVHLLPVYDFQTVNELTVNDPNSSNVKFNWGYDPQNYNVPEGSYSTNPLDPGSRITEFKQMVQAMHDKGIRVVMDVVYNHTYSIEEGPFNKIVPSYYYRMNNNGLFSNGSGVGNEIATERPMVRKYIKDSVKYWAQEYNVDGFRFDLMGIIDTTTMDELTKELHQEVDPSILIYGEPWMGGSTPLPGLDQTLKGSQKGLDFAVFNDNFRSAIKGDSDGASKGYATGELNTKDGLINGIKGAVNDFTDAPTETINYVTAHDNLNLWDKVLRTQDLFEELNMLNIKDGVLLNGGNVDDAVAAANPYQLVDSNNVFANETVKRSLLANGIVLTAQGIPFIHAGDEMLRSKYGDHNSYRSPDSVNKINWSNKAEFTEVHDYYKGLIELRKSHPAFRLTTKAEIDQHLQILQAPQDVIAFKLGEYANGDDWKNIVVIYNGTDEEKAFSLPTGNWNVVVDATTAGVTSLREVSETITVNPISMMVLYDEELTYIAMPTSLEFNITRKAIEVGKQVIATAAVKDQNGRAMTNEPLSWSSSDSTIASVDNKGRITAHRNGTVDITVTSGSLSATKELHVAELVPTSITLTGAHFVYESMTSKINALVKDQFDQVISGVNLNWSSSAPSVATVDYLGTVTGKSPGTVNITASIGGVSEQLEIEVRKYVKRYIQFEYTRADQNYADWDLWIWNTGVKNDSIEFTIKDGKAVALVEIAPNVTQVGYIVRRGDWLEKDVDQDRFVNIALDESFVILKITSGEAVTTQTERIVSPVINQGDVTFKYRHDELYRNNQHHLLTDVKVKFDGEVYPLSYNATGEYFYYTVENILPGQYEYTFLVTIDGEETEISDPRNTVNGVSKVIYQQVDLSGQAHIAPAAVDYNSHVILTVETETATELISEIYADLSELGGQSKVQIDKYIKALTLSVTDQTTAGVKTIPVTLVDINQVSYTTTAEITVKARSIEDNSDFDFDEARIYFMVTDRFNDGDASNNNPNGESYDASHGLTYHGGDIQGIIDRLDYLEQLGINTIWITPIVDNIDWNVAYGQPWQYQYGYHGYWAKDFTKMDEHLGDIDTFKQLIDDAHDRGIKIMVDVVLNHAGYGMDSTDPRSPASNYPTIEEQAVFDGMIRTNPIAEDDLKGELAGLPDLMTEVPEVREQIVQWQIDWLERVRTDRGDTIDYYRVDTVKHVEHATWYHFKNELTKIAPEFKLIGEVFGAYVDDQRGYLGSGMMDSLLDFNFKNIASDFINNQIDSVEQKLQARNEQMNNVITLGQFLSSHDEDGFLVTHANGDLSKQKIAATLQITAKGQPVIYYGEELGMSGRNANFEAGIFDENRYDMPWDELEARSDMLTHYEKLLQARMQYSKVFSKGTREKIAGGDQEQYIIFERAYNGSQVYVGINTSDEAKTVSFNVDAEVGSELTNLYSGEQVTVSSDGKVTLELSARSAGGTFIIANPSADPETPPVTDPETPPVTDPETPPVTDPETPPVTDPETPPVINPDNPPATGEQDGKVVAPNIVVGAAHLVDGQYVVELVDNSQTVKLIPANITMPVVIQSSLGEITISAKQLEAWQSMYVEVSLNLATITSLQEDAINSWAQAANVAFNLQQSIVIEVDGQLIDGQIDSNGPVATVTVSLAVDAKHLGNGLTHVYQVLEDGKLHYVPSQLVDGVLKFQAIAGEQYVLGAYDKDFTDVSSNHWASDLIKQAAARGLIDGKTLTSFVPSDSITRAEFTSIVARVLGLQATDSAPFADVAAGSWYEESIVAAFKAGLVNGVNSTEFNPQGSISRQEMAVMLIRALEYKQGATLQASSNSIANFNDADAIAQWAQMAILKATEAGLIEGKSDGGFDPKGELKRAEAVKVLLALAKL